MSNVRIISDLHIGHRNILKYDPQFKTVMERENAIIEQWNSVVHKRDVVYVLGDAVFNYAHAWVIRELKGTKKLIMGNHDTLTAMEYLSVFDDIVAPIKYKGTWLTHQPMHPEELRGSPNIHGHIHEGKSLKDDRYFNVNVDSIGFAPMLFQDIRDIFAERGVIKRK